MGKFVLTRILKYVGWLATAVMAAAALGMVLLRNCNIWRMERHLVETYLVRMATPCAMAVVTLALIYVSSTRPEGCDLVKNNCFP